MPYSFLLLLCYLAANIKADIKKITADAIVILLRMSWRLEPLDLPHNESDEFPPTVPRPPSLPSCNTTETIKDKLDARIKTENNVVIFTPPAK
jgi:hypothetical protein